MSWYDFVPPWQRIERNRTTSNTEAMQAALIPIKAIEMQNEIKSQALEIAGQGLANRQKSMQLDLAQQSLPFQVQEMESSAQLAQMKLEQTKAEQSAWERDSKPVSEWMSLPWDQRSKTPPPSVSSTRGVAAVIQQQRVDDSVLRTKEMHDVQVEKNRLAAEANKIRLENERLRIETEQKKIEASKNKNGSVVTFPELPGWEFIRQPTGHLEKIKGPDKGLSPTSKNQLRVTIAKLRAKLKNPALDEGVKAQTTAEIKGLLDIVNETEKPTLATPENNDPLGIR